MLYPRTFIHPSSQFQYISLIQILGHIFNPRSGACFSSQSWYTCFIRFRLNPHLLHGACYTQPCLWCWSQLARGMPLNPLVHMFYPSSSTPVSSQLWAASLIPVLVHPCFTWIINFVFHTYGTALTVLSHDPSASHSLPEATLFIPLICTHV